MLIDPEVCRTGTLGLYTALKMLGYKPFHISELLPYNFHGMSVLQEAITSNSSNDESFSRPEFEKMWADYDVSCSELLVPAY